MARKNAELNGLKNRVNYQAGDLISAVEGKYPVVTANIVADVILMLLKDLHRVLEPNGLFITSGIIDDRKEEILNAIAAAGLVVESIAEERGWVAITARSIK